MARQALSTKRSLPECMLNCASEQEVQWHGCIGQLLSGSTLLALRCSTRPALPAGVVCNGQRCQHDTYW